MLERLRILLQLTEIRNFMKKRTCLCVLFLTLFSFGCSNKSSPRVGQKIVFVDQSSNRELGYYGSWRFLVCNITSVNGDTVLFTSQWGSNGKIQVTGLEGSKLKYKVIQWHEGTPNGYLIENPEQTPKSDDVIIGTNNVLDKAWPHTYYAFYVLRVENGKLVFSFRDVQSGAWLSKEDWARIGDENLAPRDYIVAPRELKDEICGKALGCQR